MSYGRGRKQAKGGSGTKYTREHHEAEGKKQKAGYQKDVSGAKYTWKPMGKSCVKAAIVINCSISSDREFHAMVQKVPDSGVTHRDVSVMKDLFSILFTSLSER